MPVIRCNDFVLTINILQVHEHLLSGNQTWHNTKWTFKEIIVKLSVCPTCQKYMSSRQICYVTDLCEENYLSQIYKWRTQCWCCMCGLTTGMCQNTQLFCFTHTINILNCTNTMFRWFIHFLVSPTPPKCWWTIKMIPWGYSASSCYKSPCMFVAQQRRNASHFSRRQVLILIAASLVIVSIQTMSSPE